MDELAGAVRWHCREGRFDEAEWLLGNPPRTPRERSLGREALAHALVAAGQDERCRRMIAAIPADEPPTDGLDAIALAFAEADGDTLATLEIARRRFARTPSEPDRSAFYAAALRRAGRGEEAERVEAIARAHVADAIDALPVWADDRRDLDTGTALYIDLLERTVCNWIYGDEDIRIDSLVPYDESSRLIGRGIPRYGHSMIGRRRLRHLSWAVEDVLARGVGGDLIETGVWRGGACILMRGVLKAHGAADRRVVVADSFEGLPPPDPRYSEDALTEFDFHLRPELAVDLDTVRANFDRYGLLDDQVVFARGFFADTLPGLDVSRLAILRLDGDLYSSTMDSLAALYDRVSPGGHIIVDDYGVVIDARRAIIDFRHDRGITAPLTAIDGDAVYWIKE